MDRKLWFSFSLLPLLFLLLLPGLLNAQDYSVKGRVSDSLTSAPLAFVNIVINDGLQGGVTDIDGRFSLSSREPVHTLRFSYVGYKPVVIENIQGFQQIKMASLGYDLSEVLIVAGENPAHRIIRNAVENRKRNNPENIPYYTLTSYDKMYFTANADSLPGDDDKPLGENGQKLLGFFEKQHIFLMESVAEHQYIAPGKSLDKIIATRVSGLKDPLIIFLISSIQSTSFYSDLIDIAGFNYINPISRNSEQRYFFSLRDTLYSETPGDTTFVISYKPALNRNFDGLKGLLYISNNGWAIRNVIAEPARNDEKLSVKIRQMYEFLDDKYWFPVQLETEIVFNTMNFGGLMPLGIGKSYRRHIVFDTLLNKRNIGNIAIELSPDAGRRDEAFWVLHRADTLSLKEQNTYRVIDSIGRANNLDLKMRGVASLASGFLPLGYVDLDLGRLLWYSKSEGLYAGLGLYTSKRVSQRFRTGGYFGYGFGDETARYGASLSLKLQKHGNAIIDLGYSNDMEEAAGTRLFDDDRRQLNTLNFRGLYIDRMDITERYSAQLGFRLMNYVWLSGGVAREVKEPFFDYAFNRGNDNMAVLTNRHTFGKIIAGLRFAWGEKFIRDQVNQLSMGTKYPVLWLQYTAARTGLFGGEFDYNRIDFRLKLAFYTRFVGNTEVWLTAGYVDKAVPFSELVTGRGGCGNGFSLLAPVSFTTMKPAEFLNDRFGAVFLTHNFERLLFRFGKFAPEPALIFNAGIGSLRDADKHRYAEFKTMEKGYAEAGIALNNILKTPFYGIGIAVLYRGGAYSYNKPEKNIMARLTLSYSL